MEKALNEIGEMVNKYLEKYWVLQGHVMPSSKFLSELRYEVDLDRVAVMGYSVGYAEFVDRGTPAEVVKAKLFNPGSGKKTSLYISGLYTYVQRRMGLQGKEALSVAFAIAHKHRAEGIPTILSAQHSATGKRTNFVDNAFQEIKDKREIEQIINGEMTAYITQTLKQNADNK